MLDASPARHYSWLVFLCKNYTSIEFGIAIILTIHYMKQMLIYLIVLAVYSYLVNSYSEWHSISRNIKWMVMLLYAWTVILVQFVLQIQAGLVTHLIMVFLCVGDHFRMALLPATDSY